MSVSIKSKNRIIGSIGEQIAARFLIGLGYSIFETNVRLKGAEIDILAKKGERIHLVEVKTISRENKRIGTDYRPEELVNKEKVSKIARFGQYYLISREMADREVQIDVVAVELDKTTKQASCRLIEHAETLIS